MFDNLRESAFYEEEPDDVYKESTARPAAVPRRQSNGRLLGMSAQQRFFLSVMLFLTVCLVGTLAMLLLGRMSLFWFDEEKWKKGSPAARLPDFPFYINCNCGSALSSPTFSSPLTWAPAFFQSSAAIRATDATLSPGCGLIR